MVTVHIMRDVARPAGEVFDYVVDLRHDPEWKEGRSHYALVTSPPIGVGTRFRQHTHFLGREYASTFEVVELEPGYRFKVATREATFPATVTRTVEPLGEGHCRLWVVIAGEPGGTFGLVGRLLESMARRALARDYDRLRRVLEAPAER